MTDPLVVISSARVFTGRIFNVRTDEVRFGDGTAHRLDVVEHGGSVAIVAIPAPGKLVLVRQYRHPVGAALWEIPAGTAELGEQPMAGAARELREETGYRAGSIRSLGSLYVTPGFCDEALHFFEARQLEPGEQALDSDERIEVGTFSVEEARRLLAAGEIADCKTVLALLWMATDRGEIGAAFGR